MIKLKHIRDFMFLLLGLYYAQGTLYSQGSALSQAVFTIILAVSSFYFLKTFFIRGIKIPFYNIWTTLLLVNVFGFLFTGATSNPYHISMLKGILFTLLMFYPFYYFSYKNVLKSKHLIRFLLLMVPLFTLQYIFKTDQILAERLSSKTDVVNNVAYFFVGLIPYVFLIKRKKLLSFTIILILTFFIIQGAKRGALVSGGIGLLFFAYFHLRTIEKKNRLVNYLFVSLVIIGMSYFVYDFYESNEYLVSRMESMAEGNSSGRDIIFVNIFNGWLQSDSYIHLLFGYGFSASLKLSGTGNFAHNDWLELLSNFGLFGLSIYLALFAIIVNKILKCQWAIDKKLLTLVLLLILLVNTIVYRFYSAEDGFLYSILLAYLIGTKSNKID